MTFPPWSRLFRTILKRIRSSKAYISFDFPRSWDIFYHECELHKLVIDVNLLSNKKTLLFINFTRTCRLSSFVKRSIRRSPKQTYQWIERRDAPYIASWCIRAGLTMNANQLLAETLLNSSYGYLYFQFRKLAKIHVAYSSEPVLAIAARNFVKGSTWDNVQSIIGVSLSEYRLTRAGRRIHFSLKYFWGE